MFEGLFKKSVKEETAEVQPLISIQIPKNEDAMKGVPVRMNSDCSSQELFHQNPSRLIIGALCTRLAGELQAPVIERMNQSKHLEFLQEYDRRVAAGKGTQENVIDWLSESAMATLKIRINVTFEDVAQDIRDVQ